LCDPVPSFVLLLPFLHLALLLPPHRYHPYTAINRHKVLRRPVNCMVLLDV
jgi:hypothetical protein